MKIAMTAAFVSLLALGGCSSEADRIRGEFIAGCINGGGPKSICACVFDKMESKFDLEEIEAMSSAYELPPQNVMKDVMAFALQCQKR